MAENPQANSGCQQHYQLHCCSSAKLICLCHWRSSKRYREALLFF